MNLPFLDDEWVQKKNIGIILNSDCKHNVKCLIPAINSEHYRLGRGGLIVKKIDVDNLLFDKEGFILLYPEVNHQNFIPLLQDNIDLKYYTVEYTNSIGKFYIHGKGLMFIALIFSMDFEFSTNTYYYHYHEKDQELTTQIVSRSVKEGVRDFRVDASNIVKIPRSALRVFIRPFIPYAPPQSNGKNTLRKRKHFTLQEVADANKGRTTAIIRPPNKKL